MLVEVEAGVGVAVMGENISNKQAKVINAEAMDIKIFFMVFLLEQDNP